MPQIGNNAKPTFSYHAFGGSGEVNQEGEGLQSPDQRIRVLTLGAWIGGWGGNCKVRLALWDPVVGPTATGTLLGQSAEFTVANEGAAGAGVSLYTADLETPVELDPLQDFYVGFSRDRDDAHQVFTGSNAYVHLHGRGTHNAGGVDDFGAIESFGGQARRIGAWVENYEVMGSAWVYRSGAWVRADGVKVYRSGAWADADAVKVYRSGAWVDAD